MASHNIAPLQPPTLATFLSWGIQQELVVPDLPLQKYVFFVIAQM
jgi:hypothetical protein